MQPDAICGSKEYVAYVRPHVERAMHTYGDITRNPIETEAQRYCRERLEAAMSMLERIIGQDLEDELEREMEFRSNQAYRREQNLMMARRALEEVRSANGHLLEQDFSELSHPEKGGIYRSPYGMVMLGVKEVLEKFWTEE